MVSQAAMNLHIHRWRKRLRPGEVQFGESLLRYCRCGMVRLGRLRWHEMTSTDWQVFIERMHAHGLGPDMEANHD